MVVFAIVIDFVTLYEAYSGIFVSFKKAKHASNI